MSWANFLQGKYLSTHSAWNHFFPIMKSFLNGSFSQKNRDWSALTPKLCLLILCSWILHFYLSKEEFKIETRSNTEAHFLLQKHTQATCQTTCSRYFWLVKYWSWIFWVSLNVKIVTPNIKLLLLNRRINNEHTQAHSHTHLYTVQAHCTGLNGNGYFLIGYYILALYT